MPVRIRLQRKGKKGRPFYHIVIADGRAPRDGKFIEKIGSYNPITKPAEIELVFDKALDWLQKGAQPSDTVRSILSYKGVMYKHHLLKGIKKGALTEAQVEAKFTEWLEAKDSKISQAVSDQELKVRTEKKRVLEEEKKANQVRESEISKKKAAEVEATVKAAKEKAAEAKEKVKTDEVEDSTRTKEALEAKLAESEEKVVEKVEKKAEEKVVEKAEEKVEKAEEKVEKVTEKAKKAVEEKKEDRVKRKEV